jgi:hypothetical protein
VLVGVLRLAASDHRRAGSEPALRVKKQSAHQQIPSDHPKGDAPEWVKDPKLVTQGAYVRPIITGPPSALAKSPVTLTEINLPTALSVSE